MYIYFKGYSFFEFLQYITWVTWLLSDLFKLDSQNFLCLDTYVLKCIKSINLTFFAMHYDYVSAPWLNWW